MNILSSIYFFEYDVICLIMSINMTILPYGDQAAEWHAREHARLASLGQMPAFVDDQIAAIAKVNGIILVTPNTSDFKKYSGLKLENWHLK
jgi:tRNA(fMet)-specific endonuclease VapC